MDLYEFNLKTLNQQTQVVREHGQFMATRIDAPSFILLYHLGKFFGEIWYDQEENPIIKVRAFKSSQCLAPYLDGVSFSEIGI